MGKFRLEDQDITTLAALQLFVDYLNAHEVANRALQSNLDKYIPLNSKGQYPNLYWEQKIMEKYTSLQFTKKIEAKLAYIEHLKHQDLFESHQFFVKVRLYV